MAARSIFRMKVPASSNFHKFVRFSHSIHVESHTPTYLNKDGEVRYPIAMPEWPPGAWGSMDAKTAWKFFKEGEQLWETCPSIEERLLKLNKQRPPRTFVNVNQFPKAHDALEFYLYTTKTHMMEGEPPVYSSAESQVDKPLLDELEAVFKEVLTEGKRHRAHLTNLGRLAALRPAQVDRLYAERALRQLIQEAMTLCSQLGHGVHLPSSQVTEDARVAAFWHRYYPSVHRPAYPDEPQENNIWSDGSRWPAPEFMYNDTTFMQLRSEFPLPEFTKGQEELCAGTCPDFPYHWRVAKQFYKPTSPTLVAGYNYGDPCEFPFLSVLLTSDYNSKLNCFKTKYHSDMLAGAGVMSSFAALYSNAHYQGFSQHHDLTYPLSTRTLLTDGVRLQSFSYQLNTLRLFVDDMANPRRNLCWRGPERRLYDQDMDTVDHEALRDIIVSLLVTPQDLAHTNATPYVENCQKTPMVGSLFPYLPQYPQHADKPILGEGSVYIPTCIPYIHKTQRRRTIATLSKINAIRELNPSPKIRKTAW